LSAGFRFLFFATRSSFFGATGVALTADFCFSSLDLLLLQWLICPDHFWRISLASTAGVLFAVFGGSTATFGLVEVAAAVASFAPSELHPGPRNEVRRSCC
jgi:hypothetical protein